MVPPPRDDVRIVFFCLARYPMRLCMYYCPCDRCRRKCIVRDVNLFLHVPDATFNAWLVELRATFNTPETGPSIR